MDCKKCGAPVEEGTAVCPTCGTEIQPERKGPNGLTRLLLQLISLVLCLALTVSLLAAVVLTDVYLLTSSGSIEKIISDQVETNQPAPEPSEPAAAAHNVVRLSAITLSQGSTITEADLLSDPEALTAYVQQLLQTILGEDVEISPEQVMTFTTRSTVTGLLAEKLAGYVHDAITGEQTTTFTTEDVMSLVEENEALLETIFQIEFTEEYKAGLYEKVDRAVTELDLDNSLRTSVNSIINTPLPGIDDALIRDLLAKLKNFTQPTVLILLYGAVLLLMLLILILNSYNMGNGLGFCAFAYLVVGFLAAVPTFILQLPASSLGQILPAAGQMASVLNGAAQVLAPLHYGVLALGVLLLIASLFRKLKTRKH